MENMIHQLEEIVRQRQHERSANSYTAHLLALGEAEISKKVGEEAIEVIIAAHSQGKERLISETADLIYHLTVLLVQKETSWAEVEAELRRRHQE